MPVLFDHDSFVRIFGATRGTGRRSDELNSFANGRVKHIIEFEQELTLLQGFTLDEDASRMLFRLHNGERVLWEAGEFAIHDNPDLLAALFQKMYLYAQPMGQDFEGVSMVNGRTICFLLDEDLVLMREKDSRRPEAFSINLYYTSNREDSAINELLKLVRYFIQV
jgi:hypothetical protein